MIPDSKTVPEDLADPPSNFNVETTLSKALLKLSFSDRNKIEEEIHGVGCSAVEETPELIKAALDEFDSQLNDRKEKEPRLKVLRNVIRISNDDPNNNFDSSSKSECYLNDPDVRIRFLRMEYFVVDDAVQKFISFLEFMADLFGDFIAERSVRRSDFTPKENKALKKSRIQFLPFRDRSGRRVQVSVGSANYHLITRTKLKIIMYLHWLASKDVETQRKGLVFHTYTFDEEGMSWEHDIRPKMSKINNSDLMRSLRVRPVRIAATHVYWNDSPFWRFMSMFYFYNLLPERRARTKIHFGEQTEVLYKMASFGVPVDMVPITSSGSVKFSNHCAWLDAMELMERMENSKQRSFGPGNKNIVDCPLIRDVVFRTGATSRYNPGNIYYREVMESCCQDHNWGESKTISKVARLVYDFIVQDRNGRFLEWWDKGNTWVVIQDPEYVCKKIAKAFKDFKYKRSKRESLPRHLNEKSAYKCDNTGVHSHDSALQEYYSMAHPSKRLKTSGSCFGSSRDSCDGNSCFGKNFFPTNG